MKIYTCLCLLFLAGYLVAQNNTSALLPMPNQITPVKGKPFTVRSGKTAIYLNQPELQFTAKTLQTILQDAGKGSTCIRIRPCGHPFAG